MLGACACCLRRWSIRNKPPLEDQAPSGVRGLATCVKLPTLHGADVRCRTDGFARVTDTGNVIDTAAIERLLLYIYGETNTLRNELKELTAELKAEELRRFEGTLACIQSESTALLFAMPDAAVH
jgi:hypothetical protein